MDSESPFRKVSESENPRFAPDFPPSLVIPTRIHAANPKIQGRHILEGFSTGSNDIDVITG